MCLATYGQIKNIHDKDGVIIGRVDFDGIIREIYLSYLPDAKVGDYITAHKNLAIRKLTEKEAGETFEVTKKLCSH